MAIWQTAGLCHPLLSREGPGRVSALAVGGPQELLLLSEVSLAE